MKKLLLLGLAAGLAACTFTSAPNPTLPPIAQGVSVTGHGDVKATPDTAIVEMGVSVVKPTVAEANASAADRANAIIASLHNNGVAVGDIQTSYLSVNPEWQWKENENVMAGYRATNNLTITIREVATVGEIIDAAVTAGGDDVTLNGIRFVIEDDAELLRQAREAAWGDAVSKANQLAGLSGIALGEPVTIDEVLTPPQVYYSGGAEGQGDTPVAPGSMNVTVELTVRFAMAD